MESLVDRVIAVAGASGNLGPTVVRRLASAGATLALGGREKAPLDALSADLEIEADNASVDLLDPGSARSWVDGIVARHGRVDGLVHLVGGWRGGKPIEEAPLEDWDFLHGLLIRTVQHAPRHSRRSSWRAAEGASCSSRARRHRHRRTRMPPMRRRKRVPRPGRWHSPTGSVGRARPRTSSSWERS